jgi:hypothetical protein
MRERPNAQYNIAADANKSVSRRTRLFDGICRHDEAMATVNFAPDFCGNPGHFIRPAIRSGQTSSL